MTTKVLSPGGSPSLRIDELVTDPKAPALPAESVDPVTSGKKVQADAEPPQTRLDDEGVKRLSKDLTSALKQNLNEEDSVRQLIRRSSNDSSIDKTKIPELPKGEDLSLPPDPLPPEEPPEAIDDIIRATAEEEIRVQFPEIADDAEQVAQLLDSLLGHSGTSEGGEMGSPRGNRIGAPEQISSEDERLARTRAEALQLAEDIVILPDCRVRRAEPELSVFLLNQLRGALVEESDTYPDGTSPRDAVPFMKQQSLKEEPVEEDAGALPHALRASLVRSLRDRQRRQVIRARHRLALSKSVRGGASAEAARAALHALKENAAKGPTSGFPGVSGGSIQASSSSVNPPAQDERFLSPHTVASHWGLAPPEAPDPPPSAPLSRQRVHKRREAAALDSNTVDGGAVGRSLLGRLGFRSLASGDVHLRGGSLKGMWTPWYTDRRTWFTSKHRGGTVTDPADLTGEGSEERFTSAYEKIQRADRDEVGRPLPGTDLAKLQGLRVAEVMRQYILSLPPIESRRLPHFLVEPSRTDKKGSRKEGSIRRSRMKSSGASTRKGKGKGGTGRGAETAAVDAPQDGGVSTVDWYSMSPQVDHPVRYVPLQVFDNGEE
uniref:Uncharacterized protein n=1 Tax=Chromera velia CCMP2878 TaxID=1169474 RepID=A0A0G4HT73_9ALVE|eukprot:Cvel_8386.t1-p1 / transcript=Cvel_8386.t1 / gene=Cvel_8386 / organism=Chromera_velia_CCMP2878 / gene_product=hypothetical protein / transcript_product=hypothetical protein / location=Cvel_scaffold462:53271-56170(-) / protein_length=604 / sequence_SO=supercontig / SO=protein_coding / is_pseudo=false